MGVTEIYQQQGEFTLPLSPNCPDQVLHSIKPFDHIVVTPERLRHPQRWDDATLLAKARYTGVVLQREYPPRAFGAGSPRIIGAGLVWHLGSDEDSGPLFNNERTLTNQGYATYLTQTTGILPLAIEPGVISGTSQINHTQTFDPDTMPLEALKEYAKAVDLDWKIQPNFTINANRRFYDGAYIVNDESVRVIAVRTGWGSDPAYVGMHTNEVLTRMDARRWISRARLYDEDLALIQSSDPASVYYYDGFGNPLARESRHYSAPDDDTGTFLNNDVADRGVLDELEIDTEQWVLSRGNVSVGDYIWIADPQAGFDDRHNFRFPRYRGRRLVAVKSRVMEGTWPFTRGMGVYHRPSVSNELTPPDDVSVYRDLSPWVDWEFKSYRALSSFTRLIVKTYEQQLELSG